MDNENFFTKLVNSLKKNLNEIAPGKTNTIIFAVVGLIAALLIMSIGFWRLLLIAIFVFAGVAFGQSLDGNPKLLNWLKGLFSDDK